MENITVEEPNHGTIVEVAKPHVKTYHYTNPQYTPGDGGQGCVTEIGYIPQYTPGTGGKGYVTELITGTSGEIRGGADNGRQIPQ